MMEAAGAKNIFPFQVPEPRARLRHPRDGHGAHGQRSEDVGPQQVLPDARHQEPVRDGRLRVRLGGCQNPTLTIMALAVRACDYLMQEMKAGNV